MIATPWSPIGPDRITTSPGAARSADGATPSGTRPMPAVLTNSLSAAAAADDLGVAGDDPRPGPGRGARPPTR